MWDTTCSPYDYPVEVYFNGDKYKIYINHFRYVVLDSIAEILRDITANTINSQKGENLV